MTCFLHPCQQRMFLTFRTSGDLMSDCLSLTPSAQAHCHGPRGLYAGRGSSVCRSPAWYLHTYTHLCQRSWQRETAFPRHPANCVPGRHAQEGWQGEARSLLDVAQWELLDFAASAGAQPGELWATSPSACAPPNPPMFHANSCTQSPFWNTWGGVTSPGWT